MPDNFDILLRGGRLLDGSGAAARPAAVGLRGDRIAAVGDLAAATAAQVIDVSGLMVCPGFIDTHSHSDAYLLVAPDAPSKIRQGVTTEIVGQCGCSAAPRVGAARHPADWSVALAEAGLPAPGTDAGDRVWGSVAGYRAQLSRQGHAPNVMLLAGHNTLRAGLLGYAPRPATPDEVALLGRHLEQALDEGASGLSSGLIYQPGKHADANELLALAAVVARRSGLYATHMRSEGNLLLESLDETLDLARRTAVRVQISHLKTSGRANWPKLDAALARIEAAWRDGLAVHADRYPYLASGTDLDVLLPDWAGNLERDALLARLEEATFAARLAAALNDTRPIEAWREVMIGATWHAQTRPFSGQTLDAVAQSLNSTPGMAVVRLLRWDALRTGAFFFGMSETNLHTIFAQPWVMVGSDASIRTTDGPLSRDHPHPRAYGTFARFLRLALDGGGLTLAEAVRRMTSLPATAFRITDRGVIRPGAFADLTVFDPAAIRDLATYAAPHQYATGVRWTLVNGQIAFNGTASGARPGRWLVASA